MDTVASSAVVQPRMSHFQQAMLSLYWFGSSAHWAAILLITLPKQALLIGGDAIKGQTLGIVLLIGAFVSMIVAPLFGALSDRITTRWGRRRPWIVIGTLMNVVGILGLIYCPRANDRSSLPLFVLAFMWVEFWNNVATAPYSALIPDVVPLDQRGSASGWYGLMNMLGNAVGAVAFTAIFTRGNQTNLTAIYYAVAGVLVFGMLGTVLFVKEPEVKREPPPFRMGEFLRGVIEPLRDHDFRWVFWTRFLMVMGTFTVQEFLQFFMRDVVKDFSLFGKVAPNAEVAASLFLAGLLVGAICSSLAAGVLSDRFGRKFMVYISSALQAIVPLIFIFHAPFGVVVGLGLVFGLGYGAYQAVDWALASDVLPSQHDYAKDMGVWHVAFTFPQVIATPIAGFMLDKFQALGAQTGTPHLGYTAIFTLATVYFILGTILVRQIRKVR